MEKQEMNYKTLAVALGIICALLTVVLIVTIVRYNSLLIEEEAKIKHWQNSLSGQQYYGRELAKTIELLDGWLTANQTELNNILSIKQALEQWLQGNVTYYRGQVAYLQNTIVSLNSQIANLQTQIASLNNQISTLQTQVNILKSPKLIKVDLVAYDHRPWLGTPHLELKGYICNVGENTAYNSKLHVVGYQSGGVIAIDTYIVLGIIYGEAWKQVQSNIYYSGSQIVGYTATPEWTT